MRCFKAYIAVRDYMAANLGIRGRAARKARVRISKEPNTMQHTFWQKLVFTKGHDPNDVSVAK